MSRIVDPIVLDPVEFVPYGAELDLSGDGYRILDADFGEADVELQLQRAALGGVPVGWHPDDTQTTLKLEIQPENGVSLPNAAYWLQQKLGEINEPGTEHWLRRDFLTGGEFAGSLGRQVKKVTWSGMGAWQRGDSPDISLQFVTGPYWYATTELESKEFTENSKRELIWELSEVLGTAPGLIRVIVKNEGDEDWRALEGCIESRDYSGDPTAAPVYACTALTPKGGAEEAEREGEKVIRHKGLTAGWLTVLDSEIAGVGHMTHRGGRRLKFRIYDPGSKPGDVQLRLRWRALGTVQWEENKIKPTPLVDGWSIVDLGEVRPERAARGEQRWEWQVQARAVSGAGIIDLARTRIYSTEQMAVVTAPYTPLVPDAQSAKAPGEAASAGGSGGEWKNPKNVLTSNNSRATAEPEPVKMGPFLTLDITEDLHVTKFGFAIPEEGTKITGVAVEIERSAEGEGFLKDRSVNLLNGIGIAGSLASPATWPTTDETMIYGGSTNLWGLALSPAAVNAAAFGVAIQCIGSGIARIDSVRIIVYYTQATDENRVCFASRSAEFRTNGPVRQHPTDDVWGELVPVGFNPYAPPSGLEERAVRGMIVPSQGDLGELPDKGSNKLSAVVKYRPAYLYAREAA